MGIQLDKKGRKDSRFLSPLLVEIMSGSGRSHLI